MGMKSHFVTKINVTLWESLVLDNTTVQHNICPVKVSVDDRKKE